MPTDSTSDRVGLGWAQAAREKLVNNPWRNRVRLLVPTPLKPLLKRARDLSDPIWRTAYRASTRDRRPIPPAVLRARVGSPEIHFFFASGARSADELEAALARVDRSLSDFESVLDFGCGCCRVLQELERRCPPSVRLAGCDVDHEAIAWGQVNHPRLSLAVNDFRPPLPYADDSFDLVYSSSVLTHLGERAGDEWLTELARVLRPGGYALLSVHGEHAFGEFKSGRSVGNTLDFQRRMARHRSLEEEPFVYEPYTRSLWNQRDFIGKEGTYGIAFHSERYIRERWSDRFEVLALLPSGWLTLQDLVVVRRPGAADGRAGSLARASLGDAPGG